MLLIQDDNIIQNFVERFLQKEFGKNSWDFKTNEEKVGLYFTILFLPALLFVSGLDHFNKKIAPKIKQRVECLALKLIMYSFLLLGFLFYVTPWCGLSKRFSNFSNHFIKVCFEMRALYLIVIFGFLGSCASDFVPPEPVSYKDIKGELEPINPDMITQEQMNKIRAGEAKIGKKPLPDLTNVRQENGD